MTSDKKPARNQTNKGSKTKIIILSEERKEREEMPIKEFAKNFKAQKLAFEILQALAAEHGYEIIMRVKKDERNPEDDRVS